jgi:polyferredoxin
MMPTMIELWAIPAAAVVLSLREKRYWCRKLCPLGALVRFFASFNPFLKTTVKAGKHPCQIDQRACERVCNQCIGPWRAKGSAKCTKCLECYVECEHGMIGIKRFGTPDAVLWLRRFFKKLKRRLKKQES